MRENAAICGKIEKYKEETVNSSGIPHMMIVPTAPFRTVGINLSKFLAKLENPIPHYPVLSKKLRSTATTAPKIPNLAS
jgi:hypothetical protein